jgi:hypothetical protein
MGDPRRRASIIRNRLRLSLEHRFRSRHVSRPRTPARRAA